MIQRDSRAIDLTEARAVAGNFRHQGRLAETHFTQALGEAFVSVDRADPAGGASGKLAEREKEWAGE